MRPVVVVVGVFVLILGCALISVGPFLTTSAFYKEEVSLMRQSEGGNSNMNSTYLSLSNDLDQATRVVILGVILAPIGGTILAYGLITRKGQKAVTEASRNESEPPVPSYAN